MERFPVEFVYLIVFAGFVLFNWLTQKAVERRQQEEQAREGEAAPDEPPPFEEEAADYSWGRAPVTETAPVPLPVARPAKPALAVPTAARLHPVRALLKGKSDLRRAVILTMVLGPCRAQEPPDQR